MPLWLPLTFFNLRHLSKYDISLKSHNDQVIQKGEEHTFNNYAHGDKDVKSVTIMKVVTKLGVTDDDDDDDDDDYDDDDDRMVMMMMMMMMMMM